MQEPGARSTAEGPLERVAAIARELAQAEGVDDTLQRIVDLGCEYVDGCESASITFIRHRALSTPVFSSRLAYDVDQSQYQTGMGPCLQAIAEHETVVIDDLGAEERWPAWRARALDLGIRSSISFRLFLARGPEETMGALNMYATVPGAFGADARAVGQVFASHAAVALKASITEAGLEQALAVRDVVGRAKGVLMERDGLTADEAYAELRRLSSQRGIRLPALARQVAETGEAPTP